MATVTPCAPEPWDEAAHAQEIARLAWILGMTIRIETAPAPDLVRQALRDMTAAGVEPHRALVRRARARLRLLGARQTKDARGADP
jgi:hypothetical protein